MFKFEKVKRFENVEIAEPVRKTKNAACYDMVAAEDVIVYPMARLTSDLGDIVASQKLTEEVQGAVQKMVDAGKPALAQQMIDTLVTCTIDEVSALTKQTGFKPTLIPTGYKAYMDDEYSLDLYIRSSSPLKYWLMLANSTGIIDADYADNPDNEGEIFFQVINLLPFPIKIKKGEIIGQAKFVKFAVTDNDFLVEKDDRVGGFGSTTEEVEAEMIGIDV